MTHRPPLAWRLGDERELTLDVPRVIAIVNVTPDSFSDGGTHADVSSVVDFARRAVADGADMLDIGGESTRPGAQRVDAAQQIERVVPAIAAIRAAGISVPISIDTTRAAVAAAALDAGANAINDVSAGSEDDGMFALAASRRCGVILMHRLRPPDADVYSTEHRAPPHYDAAQGGVLGVVREYLRGRTAAAIASGVDPRAIVLDPGLGFGKDVAQNIELASRMGELMDLGHALLSAASRKSFVGKVSGVDEPARRVMGSVAISVAHALAGVRLFRVHDVAAHAQALRVAHALARTRP